MINPEIEYTEKIDFLNCDIQGVSFNLQNLKGCKLNTYQAIDISKLLGIIIKD